jgi:hypothetical protein
MEFENGERDMRNQPVQVSISATELCAAYARDEAAATSSYKGKLLEVTGVVNTEGANRRWR